MANIRHLTTRRGFIAATGFGGISLYGLWVAYGAAPGPLGLLRLASPHDGGDSAEAGHSAEQGGGHGGHGADSGNPIAEQFRHTVANFIDRYRLPDGSVYPRRLAPAPPPATANGAHPMPMMSNGASAAPSPDTGHAGHAAPSASAADAHDEPGPVDVYMLAEKWFYEPAHLRLDAGVPYAFQMMATDVSHGASIHFGRGSRMIRLRPGTVTRVDATFKRPGNYVVYCTVYCGAAHDLMQARIEVV